MVSKITLLDDEHNFLGSLEELSQMFFGKAGNWREFGVAKEWKCKDRDETIVWWPDTGDVLRRYNADYQREETTLLPANPTAARRQNSWSFISTGKHRGMTLPELFFRDPAKVTAWQQQGKFRGDLKAEAEEIVSNARAIKIPRPNAKNMVVVHQIGPHDDYRGFHIAPKNVPIERCRGLEIIDSRIDMTILDQWLIEGPRCSEMLARSLMREFDRVKPRLWDRQGCQAFFEEANFLN